MWVLTLVFASVIASSMFAVLTACFHPMTRPLDCGLVSAKLATAQNVLSPYAASDMEALFASLDSNGDEVLDSDELEAHCPPLHMLSNGDDLTVEKFGRRRRRTPDEMDVDDFLTYTCMSDDKLDHMENTKCEPMCAQGFVPDDTLKCKLDGNNEIVGGPDAGGFVLKTKYDGFTTCVPSTHTC